jgi:hypothetical protein
MPPRLLSVSLGDDILVETPIKCDQPSNVKVKLDNDVLLEKSIKCEQTRSVSFGTNKKDLLEIPQPILDRYYYYIDKDGSIQNGKYIQYDSTESPHYIIDKENGENLFRRYYLADKLYIKRMPAKNNGGKRRTRRTRRTNKKRKSSTKRRGY